MGVAYKLHLLYKLVSVKCYGGIEQQFPMLVLTLDAGPLFLDNCICLSDMPRFIPGILIDGNEQSSGTEDHWY